MIHEKRKNINGASLSGTKNNDVVSKFGNNGSVDFFSSLPDDVFTKIFSMLTMRDALSLCASSKKLKHLRTSIPYVEIRVTAEGFVTKKRKFESISRFLGNHDSVVRKFQLSYSVGGDMTNVLLWLYFVVRNGIEEIDLTFDNSDFDIVIPASLLTAGTLKVLKLRRCVVNDLPSITAFGSLESLLLEDMYISDDVMGLLCCHCESLLYLTLERCSGFGEINIVNTRSKLETLILDYDQYMNNCRLNILSLKTLVIRTRKMNFSFIGFPHIDDLVLCRGAAYEITQEESENMKVNIINKLLNVKSLRLEGWAFECFSPYHSIENHQLTNLEVLGLDFDVCLSNQTKLYNLISHLESLKTLLISMKQKNNAEYHSIYTDSNFERVFANLLDIKYKVKPTVGFRNNIVGVSSNTLQNIDVKNFLGTIYEVSYIKFVLAHFKHLRVIKVTPVDGMDEEKIHAYAKLFSRFPRFSTDVYMLVGSEEVWKAEEACYGRSTKKTRTVSGSKTRTKKTWTE